MGRATLATVLVTLAVLASSCAEVRAPAPAPPPALEYIAHAAFVFESPEGVRIAIDPYNSERWLGYAYPDDVRADAVLVTHPHYDHDASYYFPAATPVFRQPGVFTIGDVRLEGHEGRHADPYGREFGQINTVWVVEAGGVRVAHFGDNGPPDQALLDALGRIDVILVPSDGQEHILKQAEIAVIRDALKPRLTIPMHYRLEGFRDLPASLDPVDAEANGASRLDTHRVVLDDATLDGGAVVMAPAPGVRAWTDALAAAWTARDAARALGGASGETNWRAVADALRPAIALAPEVLVFRFERADALARAGNAADAITELERALAGAARQDTEYGHRARARLAGLYADAGRREEAAALYRIVLNDSTRLALLEQARAFFR